MEIADYNEFLESMQCSISFDIIRCVLIFLTYFGHNLGTISVAQF